MANGGVSYALGSAYAVHGSYASAGTGNDIALIFLDRFALTSTSNLSTSSIDSIVTASGSTATAVGWGLTSDDGSTSGVQRQVNLPIASNSTCQFLKPGRAQAGPRETGIIRTSTPSPPPATRSVSSAIQPPGPRSEISRPLPGTIRLGRRSPRRGGNCSTRSPPARPPARATPSKSWRASHTELRAFRHDGRYVWSNRCIDRDPATMRIMPDFASAYSWAEHSCQISVDLAFPDVAGMAALYGEFDAWQTQFDLAEWEPTMPTLPGFDWPPFHAKGLELAGKLKLLLGDRCQVIYEKPHEDPDQAVEGMRLMVVA